MKTVYPEKDLADFHVTFDNWFSEKSLYPKQVDDALDTLKKTDIFTRKTAPGDCHDEER